MNGGSSQGKTVEPQTMPHQQARIIARAKRNASCDAAARTYCDAPCCIRSSATREGHKQIRVMKLTGEAARRGRYFRITQHLSCPQVGGQVGVVRFEGGDGRVVRLGDAAEGLSGLYLMKRSGLGRARLGPRFGRFCGLVLLLDLGGGSLPADAASAPLPATGL